MYQSFSTHSHTSSIRCLASNGKYVASGGCDDRICVYDLEARQEVEDLYIHDGTVTSLQFVPDCSYLISCGVDGKMAFTKTNNWKVDKVFEKAHKGNPVNYVSVHSSGKLALSIGNDMILRTWNLINGRQAFATSLKNKAFGNSIEFVAWSISGEYFLVAGKDIVEVWSTEKAEVISTKKCESEPTSICWITDTDILVGMENGKLLFYNWEDENEEATMCEIYDNNRVKAMKYHDGFLTTASSSGELNLWKVIVDEKVEIEMICGIDVGCRLTCLEVIDLAKIGIIKEVKEEDGEEMALKKTDVKKFKTKGTVVVEIDNDDDDNIAVTPKPSKKRQHVESSSKKKPQTPMSNKKKRKSVRLSNGFVEEDC